MERGVIVSLPFFLNFLSEEIEYISCKKKTPKHWLSFAWEILFW